MVTAICIERTFLPCRLLAIPRGFALVANINIYGIKIGSDNCGFYAYDVGENGIDYRDSHSSFVSLDVDCANADGIAIYVFE
jgi:hypothetical protein